MHNCPQTYSWECLDAQKCCFTDTPRVRLPCQQPASAVSPFVPAPGCTQELVKYRTCLREDSSKNTQKGNNLPSARTICNASLAPVFQISSWTQGLPIDISFMPFGSRFIISLPQCFSLATQQQSPIALLSSPVPPSPLGF